MRVGVDLLGVLAEVWMLYYLYENILERKVSPRWQRIGVYAVTGVLFMLLSTYVAVPRVRTALYLLFCWLPLVCYQGKWPTKILTGLMYIAAQIVVEMAIKAALLSIYGSDQIAAAQYYEISVLLSKALAFLVIYAMVSLFRVQAKTLSLKLLLALLILPTATIITIYKFMEISYISNFREGYLQLMVVSVLLIGANIAMCYLFGRMSEIEELRRRETLAQYQIESQQKQYAQLAAHQEDVRRLEHDRKRQLQLVANYLENGAIEDALDYLKEQEVEINQKKLMITGYSLIDSVLASKKALAQRQGIVLICRAHWQPELSLPEADIAIMLDNGLDNALEATARLPESSRQISVRFRQQLPLLHIVIRNPVDKTVDTSQGFPATSKKDTESHGFGLANMDKLARKHGGSMLYECEDKMFILRIMVNISNDGIGTV